MTSIPTTTTVTRTERARHPAVDLPNAAPQVKILLVDDQPANLLVLEAVLEGLGHVLVRAQSGEEALKCVLKDDFAVILMDVFMPGMDGFETAEFIRKRERSRRTPIIFLTAIGTSETHVSRGYGVGGVDYLFKPIVPEILRAKVAAFVDLYLKTATIAQQAELLREFERQRHRTELAKAQRELEAEKLQQDVRAARKVQQALSPRQPPSCPGFDISGASYPADATGGDYFDYFLNPDGFLDVVIGDVCGHGLAAALLMSATRAYLRALALARTGVDDMLTLANRALEADTDDDRFVTLLYARLDPGRRSLGYVSAGHPDGYVMSSTGDVRIKLESTALPLGIAADGEFSAGPRIDLEAGDLIFLLTDGITEAANPDGTLFGANRALNVLRSHLSSTAVEIVQELHQAVKDFMKQPVLQDDITAIVIKVT
jgi:serine phosphatase RsbU (regulator of sigma subunit)